MNPIKQERKKRNENLDAVRGFALLGILIINVQVFAMPGAAYHNPTAVEHTALDGWIWSLNHIFADQKFMAIFSMLFGAGAAIFMDNASARGARPGPLFLRRLVWLLAFGLIHAYAIWHGDILVTYAICGLGLIFARRLSERTLWRAGWGMLIAGALISAGTGLLLPFFDAAEMAEVFALWQPSAAELARETAAFRGDWTTQMPVRAEQAFFVQTAVLTSWSWWRVTGLMLLGMSLHRSGFFESAGERGDAEAANHSRRRSRRYWIALPIGLALSAIGLYMNELYDWRLEYSMFAGSLWNYFGSVLTAIGYMGVLLFVLRSGFGEIIRGPFAQIGRTAFSGYIFQSLAGTLIFYGHGMGAFAMLSRLEQWGVVLLIWAAQMALTRFWLSRFSQGPLEALWRRLTYGLTRATSVKTPAVLVSGGSR